MDPTVQLRGFRTLDPPANYAAAMRELMGVRTPPIGV